MVMRFTNSRVAPLKGSFCCLVSNIYHSRLVCHLAARCYGLPWRYTLWDVDCRVYVWWQKMEAYSEEKSIKNVEDSHCKIVCSWSPVSTHLQSKGSKELSLQRWKNTMNVTKVMIHKTQAYLHKRHVFCGISSSYIKYIGAFMVYGKGEWQQKPSSDEPSLHFNICSDINMWNMWGPLWTLSVPELGMLDWTFCILDQTPKC